MWDFSEFWIFDYDQRLVDNAPLNTREYEDIFEQKKRKSLKFE